MSAREDLFECALHGDAYTHGCPGCEDAHEAREDADIARTVRRRLRWWTLPNLCSRAGHFWRELEPGVERCRVCRMMCFRGAAASDAFIRHLSAHTVTCAFHSDVTRCDCNPLNRDAP